MDLDPLRRAVEPALRRVLHVYWRFARGMTLGVRAVVIDPAGPRLSGEAQLRGGLASARRRRRDRRDRARGAGARTGRGGRHHGAWCAAPCTASSSTRASRAAIMSRSLVVRDFTQDGGPRHAPRDRRSRLLRAGRAAARHDARHACAARRGAQGRADVRALVSARACAGSGSARCARRGTHIRWTSCGALRCRPEASWWTIPHGG